MRCSSAVMTWPKSATGWPRAGSPAIASATAPPTKPQASARSRPPHWRFRPSPCRPWPSGLSVAGLIFRAPERAGPPPSFGQLGLASPVAALAVRRNPATAARPALQRPPAACWPRSTAPILPNIMQPSRHSYGMRADIPTLTQRCVRRGCARCHYERGRRPLNVAPLVPATSWPLPQQEFANLIGLRRVLSRPGAWTAHLGRARLAALEDGACRYEGNRYGHCDANGGNDRDKNVMEGLHVDGH